ncbi:thioesterase family protein [Gemmobacter sp.]|uniref:acyl-CoA thioesterase n=1 Tax=Gemmobacter sp. TaxID=1898957 RepID=UPI002AFE84B3|nr:thioesterase family protein [Gemmobacter sp.]
MARVPPAMRSDYAVFLPVPTRWEDNDRYGHMNNAVHYRLVDTAVNRWLIGAGLLDLKGGDRIGLVVESGCRYHSEMGFPDDVTAGLRIGHLGGSSVRWEVGLFRNAEGQATAEASFVHVYVNAASRRPEPLPDRWRAAMAGLVRG